MREDGFYWLKMEENKWTIGEFLTPYWEVLGCNSFIDGDEIAEYYTVGDKIPSPCS